MSDRTTTIEDCPSCGGRGTFECYEQLGSNLKVDNCLKCEYTVNYTFTENPDGSVSISKVVPPTNMSTQEQLKNLQVEFLHGVPVSLLQATIDQLMDIITQQNKAAVEAFAEELKSKQEIYVKHGEYVTQINEPPLIITTDIKFMIPLSAITEALAPQPIKQRSDRSER